MEEIPQVRAVPRMAMIVTIVMEAMETFQRYLYPRLPNQVLEGIWLYGEAQEAGAGAGAVVAVVGEPHDSSSFWVLAAVYAERTCLLEYWSD